MKLTQRDTPARAGIVGWKVGENSFGVTLPYLHFLRWLECDVRILTPQMDIHPDLDLVVLPGGKDLPPTNYGQLPDYYNSDPDQFKEAFYNTNLDKYIEAGIPVLGICLGFQQLVVKFGGKLRQNIGAYGHSTSKQEERGELVNTLVFPDRFTKLELNINEGKKAKTIKCCSLHHQGALVSDVPDCFDIIATDKESKVVEIIRHKTKPILGVQMHPEEDFNDAAVYLIDELINKSPNYGPKETLSGAELSTL